MILPWNTDAPIYHFPFATIGLIVLNVVAFVLAIELPEETLESLMLHYEHGWQPTQWFTSLFLHAGILHLVGNMVFLWTFGLVIEGKIGWWRFLIVYLGIGIVQSSIEQAIAGLIGQSGGSLGASAAIYGLIGIAMIWAPMNEMSCLLILGFRVSAIEIPILAVAGFNVAYQFFLLWLTRKLGGSGLTGEFLHLMGFALGLVVGVVMYYREWVDCEAWDLFAVLKGREGEESERIEQRRKKKKKKKKKKPKPTPVDSTAEQTRLREAIAQWNKLVGDGHFKGAATLFLKMKSDMPSWAPTSAELVKLTSGLIQAQAWDEAIGIMVEHLQRYPEQSIRMRLQLAQVLLQHRNRPTQALRVLAKVPAEQLPANLASVHQRLERAAHAAQDKIGTEIETEDW